MRTIEFDHPLTARRHRSGRRPPAADRVAVVGIGCRFPGANGPDEFWKLLARARDTVGEVPPQRFDIGLWHDPRPAVPGRIATRAGGFLDRIDLFDAGFFGISPYEAARMDPQQRLLLEVAWEALEDAGAPPLGLAGSDTGVFVGQTTAHYWDALRDAGVWDIYSMIGAEGAGCISSRVAYALDLRGPAVTLDASCSSSLSAVNLACGALRSGEIDLALVGGTNLVNHPADSVILSQSGVLSPRGRCHFGDASADGYVRSEGVGVVVLKPLARAEADGDRIYAVILGGATTHDGASNGLFLTPSVAGQEHLLLRATAGAGLTPADVDYVEAHGTGTAEGDAAELTALGRVFGDARPADRPLLVGSVKSNIGHTEAAAGIAGLIKAALSLWHKRIPATLHASAPNPRVPWTGIELAGTARPWPQTGGRPAVAGVSAFGLAGQNAHVVLGEAPAPASSGNASRRHGPYLLPLSARDPRALRELAARYEQLLAKGAPPTVADICYSAGSRRSHLSHRLALVADSGAALLRELRSAATSQAPVRPARTEPKVVFVFPGAGSQRAGMARRLLHESPVFRTEFERCDAAIRAEVGWSALELLRSARVFETADQVHPVLWAVEVALAAVWKSWGVRPDAVIGHSVGEIAAATVAGALSLEDAAAVVCRRGALMRRYSGQGAMGLVQLGMAQVRRRIAERGADLEVAATNAPRATVLSGDADDLDRLLTDLSLEGVHVRTVRSDVASHSARMDPILDELRAALVDIRPRAGRVPIRSAVHTRRTDGADLNADYWAANLRSRVAFHEAVAAELAEERRPVLFVELSPHPILSAALADCAEEAGADARIVGSLRQGRRDAASLFSALGDAFEFGCAVDWAAVHGEGAFVPLPTYPWQRKRYWIDDALATEAAAPGAPIDGVAPAAAGNATAAGRPARADALAAAEPGATGQEPLFARSAPVRLGARESEPGHAASAGDPALTVPAGADLLDHVVELVAGILRLPPGEVDTDLPMIRLGLDSLMAVDLSRRAERALGVRLSVGEALSDGGTLRELVASAHNEPEPAVAA